jgi:hypothetical protein
MESSNRKLVLTIFLAFFLLICASGVWALSARGHLIAAGKSAKNAIIAPVRGVFYDGPRRIADAYQYEVYGREKEEKRGRFRYKVFALWRAPGEEAKAIIDGGVASVASLGEMTKNLLSIFFSD